MTDENRCDLSKWKLLLKHLEKNPKLELSIVMGAILIVLTAVVFVGRGIEQGVSIATEKAVSKYVINNE